MKRELTCAMLLTLTIACNSQADIWNAYDGFSDSNSQYSPQVGQEYPVWNAYDGFSDSNTADNVWQYFSVSSQGTNSGYTLLDTYEANVTSPARNIPCWYASSSGSKKLPYVGKRTETYQELRAHPYDNGMAAAIGWKSPITGYVDVTFSVTERDTNGDGVSYYLFLQGDQDYLKYGVVNNNNPSTGDIFVPSIAVEKDMMLYLQIGPGAANDISGDTAGISLVVAMIPEPSSVSLLFIGLFGVLICPRRARQGRCWIRG
ncbi:MAG: PEP-CTERM sorting domain-containing protein [Thermoguttaceae bacterium]|jgi:hypothetical protein|nr:PEP-CTERM sorting domain-containing protein [Thermoguttaceae bacterium]